MANEQKAKTHVAPKVEKDVAVKKEAPKGVEQPKVNPYKIPCINLKLSVSQLNEIRSAILCKIAHTQIKLECCNIPQEIQIDKSNIASLTTMAKDLTNVLNQALEQLAKPTIESKIDIPSDKTKN